MGGTHDLTVIGAGIAGLWCAWMAQRAGMAVRVVERGSERLDAGCSWRAGGMLAPEVEAELAEPVVSALGRRSLELWRSEFPDLLAAEGTLLLPPRRDPAQLNRFRRLTRSWQEVEAAALEPALAGLHDRGLFYPTEGHVDPRRVLPRMAEALRAAGAELVFDTALEPEEAGGAVLDCRGLDAGGALPDLRGVKGEMLLVRTPDIDFRRPVRLLHPRHPIYVVPRDGHVFMIGATTVESGGRAGVTVRSAGELLTQAYAVHPAFGDAEVLEMNAGLRPAFPDNRPRLVRSGRTIRVNGLYRHGYLLAPAMAERAVAALQGGPVELE